MMNHGYDAPAKGTTDWHIPLNENFTKIDTDVEIRDQSASRTSYEPKQGAKFLATDTGDVFLGDGSSWQLIGTLSTGEGGGAVPIARPGELQETIERFANSDGWPQSERTHIHLEAGRRYQPQSTIEVGRGVALHFNRNPAEFVEWWIEQRRRLHPMGLRLVRIRQVHRH